MTTLDKIIGEAKIRSLREKEGSTTGEKTSTRMFYKYKKGEATWEELTTRYALQPRMYKMIFRLDFKPIKLSEMKDFDPQVRVTRGLFSIKKLTPGDGKYNPLRPYQIGQDIVRMKVAISGPKHWHALAEVVPELKWIEKYSTLTDDWFELLDLFPGTSFYFSVDWVQYYKDMIEWIEENDPNNIDDYMISSYIANWELEQERIKLAPKLKKFDYRKALMEIQEWPEVKKEMEKMKQQYGNCNVAIQLVARDLDTGLMRSVKNLDQEEKINVNV